MGDLPRTRSVAIAVVVCTLTVVGAACASGHDGAPDAPALHAGVADHDWVRSARAAVLDAAERPGPATRKQAARVGATVPALRVAASLGGVATTVGSVTARVVAAGMRDGRLLAVDAVTGKDERLASFHGPVLVAEDQSRGSDTDLVVAAEDAIWRVGQGGSDPTRLMAAPGVTHVAAAAGRGRDVGGNVVAFDQGPVVVLADTDSDTELGRFSLDGPVHGLAVSSWTADVFVATPTSVQRFAKQPGGGWTPGWTAQVPTIDGLTFRPDGAAVVVWSGQGATAFDTATGAVTWSQPDAAVTAAAFSPDGFRLVTADPAGVVVVRTPTGRAERTLLRTDPVAAVRFAGAGRVLVFTVRGDVFGLSVTDDGPRGGSALDRLCSFPAVVDTKQVAAACA